MPTLTMTSVYVDDENEFQYDAEVISEPTWGEVKEALYMDLLGSASHEFRDLAMKLFESHLTMLRGVVQPFSFSVSNSMTPRETNFGDRVVFVYLP